MKTRSTLLSANVAKSFVTCDEILNFFECSNFRNFKVSDVLTLEFANFRMIDFSILGFLEFQNFRVLEFWNFLNFSFSIFRFLLLLVTLLSKYFFLMPLKDDGSEAPAL